MAHPAIIPYQKKAYTSMETPTERQPKSCITGEAQTVCDKVTDMLYPARTTQFLLKALRQGTFDSWGYHNKAGTDVHGCFFHLATWSRTLECPKQTVLRTRDRLIEAKVIWFIPDPEEHGYGRIGWNMNLDEWKHIGPGGAREGAGNPHFSDPEYQAHVHSLKENKQPSINSLKDFSSSTHSQFERTTTIKLLTDECLEDRPTQAPLVSKEEERYTNKDNEEIKGVEHDANTANRNNSLSGAIAPVDFSHQSENNSSHHVKRKCKKPILPTTEDEPAYKVAKALRLAILSFAPDIGNILPEETTTSLLPWVGSIRLLLDKDKRDPHEIRAIIDWLPTANSYWRSRFLSPRNNPGNILRVNFPSMREQYKQKGQNHARTNLIHASTIQQAPTGDYVGYRDDDI